MYYSDFTKEQLEALSKYTANELENILKLEQENNELKKSLEFAITEMTKMEIALNNACHYLYNNEVGTMQPHEYKNYFLTNHGRNEK